MVHLVRPDANLMVAAVAGSEDGEATLAGRTSSLESWDRQLSNGESWRELRFVPAVRKRSHRVQEDARRSGGPWRAGDRLYASQAAPAITNARLRGNVQRALIRREQEQRVLRAREEDFRQAFECAPGGMAMAEAGGGESHGRLLRVNDALCRLLGRPAALLRRFSFADLVHLDDAPVLRRTAAVGGPTELRLRRRNGSYVWVSLRNAVVADATNGPRLLVTYVEDIEERKQRELWLARRLSEDPLTSLLNGTELRARLGSDEFVILVEGVSRADAADLADRLGKLLAAPVAFDGRDVLVTVLVGVSWAQCGTSTDEILSAAVEAAYTTTAGMTRV